MDIFEKMIKRLQDSLNQQALKNLAQQTLNEHLPELEDINVAQLMEGRDAEGELIEPKYQNPLYEDLKHSMNPKPPKGTPDIKKTGDFHESIVAKPIKGGVKMDATNWKKKKLTKKYGPLLGISPENLRVFKEDVYLPYFKDKALEEFKRKLR